MVALAFGLVTPLHGMCLLVAARMGERPIHQVLKDVFVILIPMVGTLRQHRRWGKDTEHSQRHRLRWLESPPALSFRGPGVQAFN